MTSFRAFCEFTFLRSAIFASKNLFSSRTLHKLFYYYYFFFGQWKWLCYFLSECNSTSESHFANIFFDAEWCFINVAGKLHLPRWSYRENNSCGSVFLNLFFFYRDFNAPRKPCLGLIQAGWTLNIITSFQDYRSMSMIYLINITFDTTRPLLHMFNTEILSRSHPPKDIHFIVILHSSLDINLLSRHTLLNIPKWKRSRWITVVGCLCRVQFIFFWQSPVELCHLLDQSLSTKFVLSFILNEPVM